MDEQQRRLQIIRDHDVGGAIIEEIRLNKIRNLQSLISNNTQYVYENRMTIAYFIADKRIYEGLYVFRKFFSKRLETIPSLVLQRVIMNVNNNQNVIGNRSYLENLMPDYHAPQFTRDVMIDLVNLSENSTAFRVIETILKRSMRNVLPRYYYLSNLSERTKRGFRNRFGDRFRDWEKKFKDKIKFCERKLRKMNEPTEADRRRQRLTRERMERNRLTRVRTERERLDRERTERERLDRERMERERLERERDILPRERLQQRESVDVVVISDSDSEEENETGQKRKRKDIEKKVKKRKVILIE